MLGIFGWLVLCLVGIALFATVLLLALPMVVTARGQTARKPTLVVGVALFGGALPAFTVVDTSKRADKQAKAKAEATAKKKSAKKVAKREKQAGSKKRFKVPAGALLRNAPDLLASLSQVITIRQLSLEVDFGFDDPSDTGAVFGLLTPILYGIPPHAMTDVQARPDFGCARLDGAAVGTIAFVPFGIIRSVIRYGWTVYRERR